MILLLDTHLLLWAAGQPDRLSPAARDLITDASNVLWFSAASIWEVTIKHGLGRDDFHVEPHLLRRGLLENGYRELAITGAHTLAVSHLPAIHRDPFDRLLVAQAESEGVLLLTADEIVARYPGPVRRV
ncbi:type II toxin-antitoxin system VapC family toxin [Aquisalimonas sp. 2447]|uniref:type II toxin-antitoxin system VapC family toxin n=1 Tax=Aquisalimonas sp. 2447 TaxID=2740807 RepID=UPI0014323C34|nr:type II toxin-antitoxin system VapC family toxin [Aquisalimonas sp. 2447]QIT55931.1 type II toxin-antitoxin system VapC family toxin [Aquisalimonas sp. 2447]